MLGRFSGRLAGVMGGVLLIAALLPASVALAFGPAAKLAFIGQPANTAAGATMAAITVAVEDSSGNVVTTDTSTVALALTGPGPLNGTVSVAAVSGVATFSTLSISAVGTGDTLGASDDTLTGATSNAFNILGATQLAFVAEPQNAVAGATLAPITVQVEDANGAIVPASTASVSIGLLNNPGGSTLSGTTPESAVAGVATFSNLSLNNAGTGYTLVATSTGLTGATSSAFNITGPAAKLAFVVQPTNTAAGSTISPAVTVQIEDSAGNLVSSTASVALSLNGTGALTGGGAVAAVGGVATFGGLSVSAAGTGDTLTATSGGLTSATSSAFNIFGAPTKLVFTTQPTNTAAGSPISPVVTVAVEDASGNVVTSSTASVSIAILNNPGGGTLSGTTAVNAVAGVATFSSLSINAAGPGYTLSATSAGLASATSNPFNITGSTTNHLVFVTQPNGGAAGAIWTEQPVVAVENSLDQVVTTDNSYVYLSIETNPAGGTLSCTGDTTLQVSGGYAYFSGCSINIGSASYYTLEATSSAAYTAATSGEFLISGSSANQLVFVTQPNGGAAGAVWTQQPVVAVENSLDQVVTTDNTYVYLSIETNPAGGTLSCTGGTTLQVSGGYAYFSGCSINIGSASYYTLEATSSAGYTAATSGEFLISGTSATQLIFITQPGGGAAGAVWTQQPVVAKENSLDQIVTTDSSTYVYLSIETNPAGGTLSCTGGTTKQLVNGYAYFSGCSINLGSASSYYTLTATSSAGYTAATSAAFYIGGALTPVTMTSAISQGVNKGTSGFSISSQVVPRNGYITILVQTSPSLAGLHVQVWVKSKTVGWHLLTGRVVASDGSVHYYARVNGWTGYQNQVRRQLDVRRGNQPR